MRVIYKQNGKQYDIPDNKYDPNLWQTLDGKDPVAKSEGLSQYAPIIGQILGGIGGGLVGGPVGAVAGAGAGGALGEGIHQKIAGEQTDYGKILKEGAWGVGGELTGLGIAKLGGKLLGKGATSLAEKAIGATPTQATKFLAKTGKTVGEFGTESGLLTRNLDDVVKALKPVNESYKAIAGSTGTKLAKKELVNGLVDQATTLEKSIIEADKARAKDLFNLAANIDSKYGEVLSGNELMDIKKIIASEGKNMAFDPGSKSIYKSAEDVARNSLYKGAGDQTAPLSMGGKMVDATLPQIGEQERNLMALKEIVAKQSNKGKGAELLGLGTLGRSGVGAGSAAGLSIMTGEKDPAIIARNALMGATLSSAANNPKIIGLLVKGMSKGGKSLTEAATMAAGSKAPLLLTLLSQATGQGVKSVIEPRANNEIEKTENSQGVNLQQGSEYKNSEADNKLSSDTHTAIISPKGDWRWDENVKDWVPNDKQAQPQLDADKIKQLMVMDLIQTDGKNFSKLETLNKVFSSSGGKPMTAGQKKELSDYEVSEKLMSNLIPEIESASKKGLMGPISGRARIANPYDTDIQTFNSNIKAAAQVVGRAMEGGVLRKEDIPKYEAMLPNVTDTKAVALGKIRNVQGMLELQRKTKESTYSGSENVDDGTGYLQNLLNL